MSRPPQRFADLRSALPTIAGRMARADKRPQFGVTIGGSSRGKGAKIAAVDADQQKKGR